MHLAELVDTAGDGIDRLFIQDVGRLLPPPRLVSLQSFRRFEKG